MMLDIASSGGALAVKCKPFILGILIILAGMTGSSSKAFEINYPGEDGFFIGKPMIYKITANSSTEANVGQEGTFIFGSGKIVIDGIEYYDSVFRSPTGSSNFYFGIDSSKKRLTQKGFDIGKTEIKIKPTVTAVEYPVAPGKKWSEKTEMTAKNLIIPGLGMLETTITAKDVKAETQVYSKAIIVPAGTFDTLLIETTFTGSLLGIPMTLVERTWLNEDNVAIKRNFEFIKPTSLMLYEIQLSKPSPVPHDLNWDKVINILDLIIVAKHFGRLSRPMIPNPDLDGNGEVNALDLLKVASRLGESYDLITP